jgi:Na+-transporting NADH:ubiquinone oxidoreductase subunit F
MSQDIFAILIAAGVTCGVATALAVLLLIAERYLANYGQCTITVNGEKKLDVTGGQSLLATLKSQGIFIASACGGRGTCAFCKVKVLDGAGPLVPTEEPLLSDEEKQNNVRVSCQIKVREDMAIEIPEELLSVKQYRGRVERIRDLTHDIKELRIELIDPETIDYHPGHYVQLEAPAYGDNPDPVSRAYSLSSVPSDNRHIELIIRLVPGGICTTWVFEHLSEGDEVTFTGPYGDFRISESATPMVWIAGGSGMAPFWSMVRYLKEVGNDRPVQYFFGAVTQKDLFFTDELKQLEGELDWFTYTPALSGENLQDWSGETGLITEVVGKHVSQDTDAEGYLCGSPGMCDASVKVLAERGIPEEKVFFDKFA